jgi:hypothetical protein
MLEKASISVRKSSSIISVRCTVSRVLLLVALEKAAKIKKTALFLQLPLNLSKYLMKNSKILLESTIQLG